MKSRGKGGAIVNVSSVAGLYGCPAYVAYSASKGALQQLTHCMAVEFGHHKVCYLLEKKTLIYLRPVFSITRFEATLVKQNYPQTNQNI